MRLRVDLSYPFLMLMGLLAFPSVLLAAPEDTVQAYVSSSIMHDDNLLRVPTGSDPVAATGQPSTADTITQGALGLKVDWKQSRQELILDASVNETRFSRFSSLGYQGTNIQARWNWQLGNKLSGDIGYNRNTSLGSFAEVQRLASNLSTQRNEFMDMAWQARPNWRLNGSLNHSTYSVTSSAVNGNEFVSSTLGASYTPPSGNEIGVRATHQVQKYPALQQFSGVSVDNGFTQNQFLATANWLYSGLIRINGQAGLVKRAHNQLAERDFSGGTMRGTLTWLASGKGQVDLSAWNEIDGYANQTTSYIQSKGVSLGPTWSPTSKLRVAARLQRVKKAFLGDPALKLTPGVSNPVRQDVFSTASLSLSYQPTRTVNITTSVQTERLGSSVAATGYADKTFSLNMSVSF